MPATDLLAASGGQTYEGLFSFTATRDPRNMQLGLKILF